MRGKRALTILLAVVLGAAAGFLGFHAFCRFKQKMELYTAVSTACSELEQRLSGSPLALLREFAEPNCKFTADAKLQQETAYFGPVTYDLTIQTDGQTHQFLAQGTADTGDTPLELSVYLDENFAAVSSEDLVQGRFYGIAYDTFQEDIRQIPFLGLLVGDELMEDWDASAQSLRTGISRNYRLPQVPEIQWDTIKSALQGLATMPCKTEEEDFSLNGAAYPCQKFSFQTSGPKAADASSFITGTTYPEDTFLTAEFYIYEKKLLKAELCGTAGEGAAQFQMEFEMPPSASPLKLSESWEAGREVGAVDISLDTELLDAGIRDSWVLQKVENGRKETAAFSYDWDPGSGNLTLNLKGAEPITMTLSKTDRGLRVVSRDFSQIMEQITQRKSSGQQIACDLILRTGSQISVPEYKKIDTWSLEDFYALVLGVGSLFGIRIQ